MSFIYKTPSPLIPLPLLKGKGESSLRGASPLLNTPLFYVVLPSTIISLCLKSLKGKGKYLKREQSSLFYFLKGGGRE